MSKRLAPVPMTKKELLDVLDDIRQGVERDDSFEGSIEYGMPIPEMEGIEYPPEIYALVRGSYRIDNTMGQGSVRLIGEWKEEGDGLVGA